MTVDDLLKKLFFCKNADEAMAALRGVDIKCEVGDIEPLLSRLNELGVDCWPSEHKIDYPNPGDVTVETMNAEVVRKP